MRPESAERFPEETGLRGKPLMSGGRTRDWPRALARLAEIIAESGGRISAEAIANVDQLVAFMKDRCPPPEVLPPYESDIIYTGTISFFWEETGKGWLVVEVEADSFEIYRSMDGTSDVRTVWHMAGNPLPEELTDQLPML
jgi:hypothetical protein